MRLLWNLVSNNQATRIAVADRDCKRSRLRSSRCEKCVEVCPSDAIVLDGGPRIVEGCVDCGLCVASCPTEVFRTSPETETYLASLLQSLRARKKSTWRPSLPGRQRSSESRKAINSPRLRATPWLRAALTPRLAWRRRIKRPA